MKQTILITAGGTGGHIFPAMALANLLQDQYNIVWVGSVLGIENEIVPKANIPLEKINISGLRKKGLAKLILLPFSLSRAFLQALRVILRHKPVVVVGFGGYATFPICLLARLLFIPVAIHEQNSVAGLTNKVLAKFVNRVMVAFNGVLPHRKTILVGNPVRENILTLANPVERYARHDGKLNVLVVGGSLGAKVLNNNLPQVFASLDNIANIVHQVGKSDASLVEEAYRKHGVHSVQVLNFIDDMALQYEKADLIICRSGASTVSEICAVGIAALFIPYPFAVDDHQKFNALPVVKNNGAIMMLQKDFSIKKMVDVLSGLTRDNCLEMALKTKELGILDSTKRIKNIVLELVK